MSVLRVPEAVLEKSGTPIAESEGLVPTLRLRRVSVGRTPIAESEGLVPTLRLRRVSVGRRSPG